VSARTPARRPRAGELEVGGRPILGDEADRQGVTDQQQLHGAVWHAGRYCDRARVECSPARAGRLPPPGRRRSKGRPRTRVDGPGRRVHQGRPPCGRAVDHPVRPARLRPLRRRRPLGRARGAGRRPRCRDRRGTGGRRGPQPRRRHRAHPRRRTARACPRGRGVRGPDALGAVVAPALRRRGCGRRRSRSRSRRRRRAVPAPDDRRRPVGGAAASTGPPPRRGAGPARRPARCARAPYHPRSLRVPVVAGRHRGRGPPPASRGRACRLGPRGRARRHRRCRSRRTAATRRRSRLSWRVVEAGSRTAPDPGGTR
jgi:hypothetical protein